MPTNKLWIEHTERAAWQSVQALREKLSEAEQRAERMAPPVNGWRELFAELDAARQSHGLSGATYAELLSSVLDRLTRAEADRRALEARFAGQSRPLAPAAAPEPPPRRARRHAAVDPGDDDLDEGSTRFERRLFGEIRTRALELDRERPRPDPDAELAEIETRLADLPALDPAEILDIAADLAALTLHLCRTPGEAEGSAGPDD